MIARVGLTAITFAFASINAMAAPNCGHDVQFGAVKFEQTKLDDGNAILSYFSPSYLVMDNPKDPRHRAVGECRGQGVVTPQGQTWVGGCFEKTLTGEIHAVYWWSKPGDKGTENRADAPQGTYKVIAGPMKGKTGKWTGLEAGGGSYFCDD
jgi:hypothetical protein